MVPSCKQVPTFTITWLNYDGSVLEIDEGVKYGSIPEFNGEIPLKEKDEVYDYSFKSWDKELAVVLEDATYTALFDKTVREAYIVPSHESGFYNKPFVLDFSMPYGFDVYYTLDNSEPDNTSKMYVPNETILEIKDASDQENKYSMMQGISSLNVYYPESLIDKCTIVKAVAINRKSGAKSKTLCLNYFIGYQDKAGYEGLPIVSLDVSDDDLFDYEKGIYVTGKIYDE